MAKPLLQIALDNLSIELALKDLEKVAEQVDVIEVGTILLAAEGKRAIEVIAKKYPNKIIIADGKIADAGQIFGKMFFEAGANYVTCICAAETSTIAQTLKVAKNYRQTSVQIELTSHFTWAQIEEWAAIGVEQVVYHRSRDAEASGVKWKNQDLENVRKLINYGFKVSITGGISIEDLDFFKKLPIYIFIAGRSLRDAENPLKQAKLFKQKIDERW